MHRSKLLVSAFAALLVVSCESPVAVSDAGDTGDAGPTADAGDVTCLPCVSSSECGAQGACVQLGGSDACARKCSGPSDCAADQLCQSEVAGDGTQVNVCVPKSGSCGGPSCPATCPAGTECDPVMGQCVAVPDAGPGPTDAGAQVCGTDDGPTQPSCCSSCTPGSGNCQANGCYGGWWCDRTNCRCHQPPTSCPPPGGTDAGTADGGTTDAGSAIDAGPPGAGTFDGGPVDHLYFAVVGDTRPAIIDDTARYPTATITGIFDAIEAMNPRPQFVVGTGDYVFASPTGTQGATQLGLYLGARAHYSGPVFPALGNHECTGATAVNCTGLTANSKVYQDYLSLMVRPMGLTLPYYAFDVHGTGGAWTAKFIVAACNAWDATQKAWVQTQLARTTTYTFVVRHIPLGVSAPCTTEMDALLRAQPYTMLLVGHTHTFAHSGNQLVEGVGGAPITGSASYGYATIEQLPNGTVKVVQWNSATRQPVATYTLP